MADPFVGEIRIFGFNFAPKGWAFCNGQPLSIAQNSALFAILGTTYGGNGQTTYALPNLQGDIAIQAGQGPGLSNYALGQEGGEETVTLISAEMPAHSHFMNANTSNATTTASSGNQLAKGFKGNIQAANQARFYSTAAANTTLAPQAMAVAGGSLPHNNMMPYLAMNFCIALEGVFPPRP